MQTFQMIHIQWPHITYDLGYFFEITRKKAFITFHHMLFQNVSAQNAYIFLTLIPLNYCEQAFEIQGQLSVRRQPDSHQ